MFYNKNDEGYNEALEGIRMKTLVYGEKTLMSEFRLDKGKKLPIHSHPHEQAGTVISGEIELTIDGDKRSLKPGDAYVIPGGVEHSADTGDSPARVLDIFSPVRDDYKY